MYKLRGRPEDPRNLKMTECHAALADAICVNPLTVNEKRPRAVVSSVNAKQKEIIRRRQNFEEFKVTYERKLRKTHNSAGRHASGQSRSTIEYLMRAYGLEMLDKNPRPEDLGAARRPGRSREQLHAKKIEVPLLLEDREQVGEGEPVRFLGRKKSAVTEKLRDVERTLGKEKAESSDEGIQADFMKELDEANKQIDVASTQLEQIQRLLGRRYLSPVQEEEEHDGQEAQPRPPRRPKPPPPTMGVWTRRTDRRNDPQKKRMYTTLETLNRRLQKMQEKYFNMPHVHYKSTNDVRTDGPEKKPQAESVCVLYKNERYPDAVLESAAEEVEVEPEEMLDCIGEKYQNKHKYDDARKPCCDVCLKHQGFKAKSFQDQQQETPLTVNFIYAPNAGEKSNYVQRKRRGRDTRVQPPTLGDDSEDNITVSDIFKPKVQESIMKSDYLMREFQVNPKDVAIRRSLRQTPEKTRINFLQAPLQEDAAEGARDKERRMYSSLNSALRNSLYSAFE